MIEITYSSESFHLKNQPCMDTWLPSGNTTLSQRAKLEPSRRLARACRAEACGGDVHGPREQIALILQQSVATVCNRHAHNGP